MKLTLAKEYKPSIDPKGLFMSEKLDGVRALWNGREFVSRNGNKFPAPEEFKTLPPDIKLDGELFHSRGQFSKAVSSVKGGTFDKIKFMVFDTVHDDPWAERQAIIKNLTLPAWCKVVRQTRCKDKKHLASYEQKLLSLGAEGVMLRAADSLPYIHKRTASLLKLKRLKTAEARVMGYEEGRGRNSDRLGALVAEFKGATFKIGSGLSDYQREFPPDIGELVTFSYFELTASGKPRFPSFVASRCYE